MSSKKCYVILLLTLLVLFLPINVLAGDNNMPETAIEITPGQQVSTGITSVGDVSWYKINVDHTCSIISEITNNSGYLNYEIYDSTLTRVYIKSAISTTAKCGYKVTPGLYYIKFSEYAGINYSTSNISLTVTLREQDQWENNDTSENAYAISGGQVLQGIGIEARNDTDWFKIEVDHTCSIVSEITNNSGYLNYEIYDSTLTRVYLKSAISKSAKCGYKITPGLYYIRLSEYAGINYSTSNISLTVSLREQDQWENNDSSGNAYGISSGQVLQGIGIEASNDKDWFKIEVDHTCSIVSEITNNSGYLYYEIYDSTLKRVYLKSVISKSEKFSYEVTPGLYYIRLSEYGDVNYSTSDITLKVYFSKEYDFLLSLGQPEWCGYVNEPVNIINGNFYSEEKDISIPTRSEPLEFIRYYNSRNTESGPLGMGWQHNYNSHLIVNTDNSISVMYGDGHSSLFTLENGIYKCQDGCFENLVKNTDGSYTLIFKNQLKYIYNSSGKLINIVDKNSNITALNYTDSLLTTVTEPGGRSLQFSYNTNNKLTKIICPNGTNIQFSYDNNNNLTGVQDLNNAITTYTYDNHGITSILDPKNNFILKNKYDSNSKVIEQEDSKGQKAYMTYDPVLRKNTNQDALGNVTTYFYDEKYRMTQVQYPDGHSTLSTYDQDYNKTSETDANQKTTTYTYDTMGNMLSKTGPVPLNYTITCTYDSFNNITGLTDAGGNVTNFTYDSNGNLLTESKTIGGQTAVTTFGYNQYGKVTAITNVNSKTSQMAYDNYGNLISFTDAKNNITGYTYDTMGRKLSETDPLGRVWTCTYDGAGNLLTETNPLGNTVTNVYDANNNLTSKTDARGNTVTYVYDENERLIQVTDQLDNIVRYTYDANGNKLTITDSEGNITTNTYDSRNRLIAVTDANNKTESYTLDGNGNILTKTDYSAPTCQDNYFLGLS